MEYEISKKDYEMTPQELDSQSKISVDEWLDVDSPKCIELDDNRPLTKKIIKTLLEQEPKYLFTDSLGRIFGKGVDNRYYPFHFEKNGKLYGYRLSKMAAN